MKKIKIHEDTELFENIKKDLKAFNPLLDEMQKAYEALEIGTFNNEVLQLLQNKGLNPIEVEFYEYIASQLDASGVTSKTIRQNMNKGSAPLFIKFKATFENTKSFTPVQYGLNQRPTLDFNLISFEDGNGVFIISPQSQDEILETYCRTYLENEKEKTLYDSLQYFVDAQDKVKRTLQDVGYTFQREDFEIQEIMQVFLNSSPDVSIKPNSIKYAVNQREQRERTRNLTNRLQKHRI